jgi:hypothetical protein
MGKLARRLLVSTIGIAVGLLVTKPAYAADCPKDSVRAGTVCIDKYEASVWQIKPQGAATTLSKEQQNVVDSIRNGSVTLGDLNKIGAVQLGVDSDLMSADCPLTGNGCTNIYAVSVGGVKPSGNVNWFQAAAAARNSFKRLPTNAEWTAAALGTPDGTSTTCNISGGNTVNTGSRAGCVSDIGAFDMVGNVSEWVADWVPRSVQPSGECGDATYTWQKTSGFDGNGYACLMGAAPSGDPGALYRGGNTNESTSGVFAITGLNSPQVFDYALGFRAVH